VLSIFFIATNIATGNGSLLRGKKIEMRSEVKKMPSCTHISY